MIPELGHFALILALGLAIAQTIFPLVGAQMGIPNWMAVAKPAAVGQWTFMAIAYSCLTYAFITNDFSVAYVAQHSNTQLPLIYRIVSVWGGHEGSLLLWNFILLFWTLAVVLFSRSLPQPVVARILAIMGFISIGFLLFMLLTSNPFDRLIHPPLDGRDLNPLLQDPGLIVHPPMLYMGYVGFSVVFSFAIAALLGGHLDSTWARWSRPWTLVAWLSLTLGIVLGSWWAYYELGWGGWWFWDPVENASFMPWLVGTALIHSLAVTDKRGAFKNWTVLLAITTFSLSLLGTFLVRSGVLTSVHAFATDPTRGIFILIFLGIIIGLSLIIYAWRAPTVSRGGHFELNSRETLLLANNVLLVVAAGSVLLGTLYPLFLDALGLGKISVGPPYFSVVFFWIMAPLMILLGIGPLARWKKDSLSRLWSDTKYLLLTSLFFGILIPWISYGNSGLAVTPFTTAAIWIMLSHLHTIKQRLPGNLPIWQALRHPSPSFYGMILAHLGIALFIIGVGFSSHYSIEKDVRMAPHQAIEVAGYQFELQGTQSIQGPNYQAELGTITVSKDNVLITTLHPQKRLYTVQNMPMTEAAIDWGLTRDIYVAMGESLEGGAWSVRVYYKPFIRWIWLGGLLMAIGGLFSTVDRRYRLS